jgi:hypothetical protein
MRSFSVIALGALLCAAGFGQITGASASALTFSGSGSIACCWSSGGSGFINGSQLRETRANDHKGATLQMVKFSAKPIGRDHLAPAAYVAMAKLVGLESAATDEARLTQAIVDCELPVYDFDKVDSYLYHTTLTMKTPMRWVWKPMREADMKADSAGANTARWTPADGFGLLSSSQYANKIPEATLATVAMILKKIPDAVFLVSDYETIKPDPFLAVTTAKLLAANKLWIVAQWDEPGFGDDLPATRFTRTEIQ